ncbi:UNVERIFIED_CONTAM: hypothetical protein RMT77_003603 [Armadillidium vulgare]
MRCKLFIKKKEKTLNYHTLLCSFKNCRQHTLLQLRQEGRLPNFHKTVFFKLFHSFCLHFNAISSFLFHPLISSNGSTAVLPYTTLDPMLSYLMLNLILP